MSDLERYIKVYIIASIAGFLTNFFTYPFDIVKTKTQADSFSSPKYDKNSFIRLITQVYREVGLKGFYNGLSP